MTIALVQSRVSSKRLPGKVLADIAGQPMIARVIERVQRCPGLECVVLVTSVDPSDDPLSDLARDRGWDCFRGDLDDVLWRYVDAAQAYDVQSVMRVTGDCPLWDHNVGARVLEVFDQLYRTTTVSNSPAVATGWPDGLDTEVIPLEELLWAHRNAAPDEREHVTQCLYTWNTVDLLHCEDKRLAPARWMTVPPWKWSVDTETDLAFVREVYDALGDGDWGYPEVVDYIEQRKAVA